MGTDDEGDESDRPSEEALEEEDEGEEGETEAKVLQEKNKKGSHKNNGMQNAPHQQVCEEHDLLRVRKEVANRRNWFGRSTLSPSLLLSLSSLIPLPTALHLVAGNYQEVVRWSFLRGCQVSGRQILSVVFLRPAAVSAATEGVCRVRL